MVCLFQEADMTGNLLALTARRMEAVDYLTPFVCKGATFVIKVPTDDKISVYGDIFDVSIMLESLDFLKKLSNRSMSQINKNVNK